MNGDKQGSGNGGGERGMGSERGDSAVFQASIDRRSLLKCGGVGAVVSVAGCLSGEESGSLLGSAEAEPEPEPGEANEDGEDGSEEANGEDSEAESEEQVAREEDEDEPEEDGGEEDGGVTHDLPFEDGFFGMDDFHYFSEYDTLGLDTSTNSEQFARPDGADDEFDTSRLNRTGEADAHVVFRFTEEVGRVRLESHSHPDQNGDISVSASTDGEEWSAVDTDRELYSEAHSDESEPGHWWENYEHIGLPDEGMYYLRITLTGDVNWSPQLGWLEVDARDDPGVVHALPFEDSLVDMDSLHGLSDVDTLRFDTENVAQFARPDSAEEETDPSCLNRANSNDADVVYRFTEQISELRAETHYHPDDGGEITVAVSPDGEEWTAVDVERDLYNEAHGNENEPGSWWENYEYTADDIDEGMYLLRFTLSGEVDWASQLGWVEVW